jgi:hypothetical protein
MIIEELAIANCIQEQITLRLNYLSSCRGSVVFEKGTQFEVK